MNEDEEKEDRKERQELLVRTKAESHALSEVVKVLQAIEQISRGRILRAAGEFYAISFDRGGR